ncbi:hypothetical protein BDF19DRAFT_392592 [Syncephalis fuscata]|nr:hypothetical protein BDF19DRAFT_392592 [Syncephalis fuscata]
MTSLQKTRVAQYREHERTYRATIERQAHTQHELFSLIQRDAQYRAATGGWFGAGYRGYGNGSTGAKFHILIPAKRKRPTRTKEVRFTKQQLEKQADCENVLVPIRLDLEADGHKLRDVFTWNLTETLITPEHFAEVLCHDLKLPQAFIQMAARSIREQLEDYKPFATRRSWLALEGTEEGEKNEELRINVKVDISEVTSSRIFVDQLEWDLTNDEMAPEEVATNVAAEMALSGEYCTAIAHSIREQVYVYEKTLSLLGHAPESNALASDEELRANFLPPVAAVRRPIAHAYPILNELTDFEMEKIERDAERDVRRKRRQTRNRRHVALPEREPMRTSRTTISQPRASSESPVLGDAPLRSTRTAKLRAKQDIQEYVRNNMNSPQPSGHSAGASNATPGKYTVFEFRNATASSSYTGAGMTPQSPTRSGSNQNCKGCGNALQGAMTVNTQTGQPRIMCNHCGSLQPTANLPLTPTRMHMTTPATAHLLNGKPGGGAMNSTQATGLPIRSAQSMNGALSGQPYTMNPMRLNQPTTPMNNSALAHAQLALSTSSTAPTPTTPNNNNNNNNNSNTNINNAAGLANPATMPLVGPVPPTQWPVWLTQGLSRVSMQYPEDRMDVIYDGTGSGGMVIRCQDCTGAVYPINQPTQFAQFEGHLRSRGHRAIVEMRSG